MLTQSIGATWQEVGVSPEPVMEGCRRRAGVQASGQPPGSYLLRRGLPSPQPRLLLSPGEKAASQPLRSPRVISRLAQGPREADIPSSANADKILKNEGE